jgi:CRP-like cAMP-binding protein
MTESENIIHPNLAELETSEPFAHLSERERTAIRAKLSVVELKAGAFLLHRGAMSNEMYFIIRGSVKIATFNNNKEAILAILRSGEAVGEVALLCGGPRTADVIALAPCRLFKITQEDFNAHLAEFGGLAHLLLKNLARRVRAASARITDLTLYDVTCRLARTLLSMSDVCEVFGETVHLVREIPTHQELASTIGASREAVTRALGELVHRGHLAIEDRRVTIYSIPM